MDDRVSTSSNLTHHLLRAQYNANRVLKRYEFKSVVVHKVGGLLGLTQPHALITPQARSREAQSCRYCGLGG